MFKKIAAGMFFSALVAAGVIAVRTNNTHAQLSRNNAVIAADNASPAANNGVQLKQAQKLPITQVVLFNSGVGYFSRSGEVDGDARVDLQFSATDINDLIKSLIIKDSKGKSVPLRYDSQEPIEKTLKSFAVDLSTNPSFGQILNQMRGQKVELTLQTTNNPTLSGLPGTLSGVIVGMETAHRALTATSPAATEMEMLNLSCAEGLRSVPIAAVQRIRFLNPNVESEFKRALDVVAVGHDSLKKTVHLGFSGEGKREVKVGYVVENPIWKTSYRMVKNEQGKWRLQAWANVENTSDDDWNDVKLTLVSSRPISFQMDLYPPLFIPRPTVEPALFASLRPPTYSGPVTNMAINAPNFGFQGGVGFGGGGFAGGQPFQNITNSINPNMPPGQPMIGGQQGLNGGTNQATGNFNYQFGGNGINSFNNANRYQNDRGLFVDNNNKLTFEQLQARRNVNNDSKANGKVQNQALAQQMGSALTNVDPEFMDRVRAADELGQPARYSIDQKVSLPRQQSVMLPILDEEIDATKVSIFNERVHATRPLHGLKMKNKTKQALMSGPVTVYEGEQPYSGDARILDLQPGEERYLSYALDTGVEISSYSRATPGPEMTVKLENGRLDVKYKQRQTKTYVIVNRAPEPRKVILEQPIRNGWKLVTPEKPEETTADLYRFGVDVKPGETVKYEVSEELPRVDPFSISKQTDWTGFATSLGLDVWTDVQRTPENGMTLQIVNGQLNVTHKDRRATKYFFRNNVNEDRTIWLEHNVPADRMLIGDHKPVEEGTNRYRIKLELKKGETTTSTLIEEFRNAKPELYQMQNIGRYATAPNENQVVPPNRFVTELGFDLWMLPKTEPIVPISARFVKQQLLTESRETESFVYYISNRTNEAKNFVLDHQVRANWNIIPKFDEAGEAKPVEGLQRCFQYTVKALPNVVTKQAAGEQRVVSRVEKLTEITPDRLKELLNAPSLKADVKDNLKKAHSMVVGSQQLDEEIKNLAVGSKTVTEEQARLRINLEKLPQTSELYKRYMSKLDESETSLEKVQKQSAEKTILKAKAEKELQELLQKLSAE